MKDKYNAQLVVFGETSSDDRGYEIQDSVVAEVAENLVARSCVGMEKYGVSMSDNPLNTVQWIDHAIEELLDAANYLTRLKRNFK